MIRSYQKYGRYYFDDGKEEIETVELIDCSLVVYDSDFGYIYKSQSIHDYEKKEKSQYPWQKS